MELDEGRLAPPRASPALFPIIRRFDAFIYGMRLRPSRFVCARGGASDTKEFLALRRRRGLRSGSLRERATDRSCRGRPFRPPLPQRASDAVEADLRVGGLPRSMAAATARGLRWDIYHGVCDSDGSAHWGNVAPRRRGGLGMRATRAAIRHPRKTLAGPRPCVQILRLLGDMAGKEVLELGAGIGRFTGVLAQVRACHQDTASEASMSRATMPKSRGRAELQAHHGGGLHASSD